MIVNLFYKHIFKLVEIKHKDILLLFYKIYKAIGCSRFHYFNKTYK